MIIVNATENSMKKDINGQKNMWTMILIILTMMTMKEINNDEVILMDNEKINNENEMKKKYY